MATVSPHVRNRLLLWLVCGLGFSVLAWGTSGGLSPRSVVGVGGSRSSGAEVAHGEAGVKAKVKAGPSLAFARWLASSGALGIDEANAFSIPAPAPTPAALARREHVEADDDEVLFAAMERLERRMAAGMIRARDSVVTLEYKAADGLDGARRAATGVVVNDHGDVLSVRIDRPVPTAGESDESASSRISARDAFGRRHPARWIAADVDTGLTLLRIAPRVVRPIRSAAEPPALGSQVFVIGNPFGLGHSVSRGQIAGLDRTLELRSRQINGLIQIQTPLFPGDSGAAVVNFRGQWLGLVRGGLASGSAEHGAPTERGDDLGFAVPADHALWIAEQLRELGRVDRAYLGVRLESESSQAAPPEGAALVDVLPDTPAARGGLQIGDRIVSFDGQPMRTPLDLTERLDRTLANKPVRLEIVRGRDADGAPLRKAIWVETANRPAAPAVAEGETLAPAPVGPPRADELPVALPRAVADRLESLERRLDQLERPAPGPNHVEAQASTGQGRP